MMNIEPKAKELLELLINTNEYITITELQAKIGLSKRSVYYVVNKCNDFLYANSLNPINNKRGKGYYIQEEEKSFVSRLLLSDSSLFNMPSADRINYLICWLLYPNGKINVEDIIGVFDISRNSVFSDLKKLKSEIEKYNLSLEFSPKEGYIINGAVTNNHAVLLHYLDKLLQKYHYQDLMFLNSTEVEDYYKRLVNVSDSMGNEYPNDALLTISCLLSIVHHVDETFDFSLLELKDLGSTKELNLIDEYFQDFNVHERLYLAVYLLGSKAGKALTVSESEYDIQLFELSQTLVERFEIVSCLHLISKSELINSLYLHFKLSFYYYTLRIQSINPLVDSVKSNYKDLFELVSGLSKELENSFPFPLTESEIIYITIHFGGHIQQGMNKLYRKIRVLVVCPSGISTSTLLKREIQNLYSNVFVVASISLDEIDQYDDIDFIVSTIDIKSKIPWIKVHSILTDNDKGRIASMMSLNYVTYQANDREISGLFSIIGRYVDEDKMPYLKNDIYKYIQSGHSIVQLHDLNNIEVSDVLNAEDIIIVDDPMEWKNAIQEASVPLLKRNIIQPSYIDAMIQLILDYGPYIVLQNGVAIAHSRAGDGANYLGLSLLINKKGIIFEGDIVVNFLFILSRLN